MRTSKPVEFLGDSLEVLRRFPELARRRVGHELDLVQQGFDPEDWKPMSTVGPGVREIRVMYITKFANTVFVLHCFQKKTQKTSSGDLKIAISRYKDLVKELNS